MKLAGGRVIMALEGGYDLPAICDASYECVRALLGDEPLPMRHEELSRRPCQNAIDSLHKVIGIQVGNAVFQFPYLSNRFTNRSFVRLFFNTWQQNSNLIGRPSSVSAFPPVSHSSKLRRQAQKIAKLCLQWPDSQSVALTAVTALRMKLKLTLISVIFHISKFFFYSRTTSREPSQEPMDQDESKWKKLFKRKKGNQAEISCSEILNLFSYFLFSSFSLLFSSDLSEPASYAFQQAHKRAHTNTLKTARSINRLCILSISNYYISHVFILSVSREGKEKR